MEFEIKVLKFHQKSGHPLISIPPSTECNSALASAMMVGKNQQIIIQANK